MKRTALAPFFNYKNEESDNGYETIQDFFLSWTLRCGEEAFAEYGDGQLNKYARQIVFLLIYGRNEEPDYEFSLESSFDDSFIIHEVRTWRQWERIDLVCEIEYTLRKERKKAVLNIENKWYSSIRSGQLEHSKQAIQAYYQGQDVKIENCLIPCDDERLLAYREECRKNDFKLVSISQIQELSGIFNGRMTGNDLFDEYWFHFYNQ